MKTIIGYLIVNNNDNIVNNNAGSKLKYKLALSCAFKMFSKKCMLMLL